MTISSSNLLATDEQQVLTRLTENLASPPHGKQRSPDRPQDSEWLPMKEDVAPGTGRHSAAAAVLQLRAELHRTKLDAAAMKADLMRLLEHAHAQRDEAREQVLGLQAALDAQHRAEAERPTPTPHSLSSPRHDSVHQVVTVGSAGGPAGQLYTSEDETALLSAITQPLSFHKGLPVAALLVFRCCVHWGTLDVDRSALVERIVTTIGSHAEAGAASGSTPGSHLCYWLCNSATLLLLLEAHSKALPEVPHGSSLLHMNLISSARNTLSMLAGHRHPGEDVSVHRGSGFVSRYIASRRPVFALKQALTDCVDSLLTELRDSIKHAVQTPLPVWFSTCSNTHNVMYFQG